MLITIDDYYNVQFYNETREALKNNGVSFNEFIIAKPPYFYYIDTDNPPLFINYDQATHQQSKQMVGVVKSSKNIDDYTLRRREGFNNIRAIDVYAINDALRDGQNSMQGIFFNASKDNVIRISKEYPRKIYFFGNYLNQRYSVFFADNLIIKNFLNESQILIESESFSSIIELEILLNYKVLKLNDRLEKISNTPYVIKGSYYPISTLSGDLDKRYALM
jgi:hypothetical protein